MARRTLSDKAARTVQFLMGARNTKIRAQLEKFGFTEAELGRGWKLLWTTGMIRHHDVVSSNRAAVLAPMHEWEQLWYHVAYATLGGHYPEMQKQIFRDLPLVRGADVTVTMPKLIERIERMGAGIAPFGADGKEARALLEARGLTQEVIAEAKEMLVEASTFVEEPEEAPLSTDDVALDRAEKAMWDWYLEWSRIARAVITSRKELRQLGFLKTKSRKDKGESNGDSTSDSNDQAPAPAAPEGNGSGTHVIDKEVLEKTG